MYMAYVYGICIWYMYMAYVYGICVWYMHLINICSAGFDLHDTVIY